jgi:predicted metalloprotease
VTRRPLTLWTAVAAFVVLALATVAFALTRPPVSYDDPFDGFGDSHGRETAPAQPDGQDLESFLQFVVGDIQNFWEQEFQAAGQHYVPAQVVAFDMPLRTPCGPASAETGPFYCVLDHRVYLDVGFFRVLAQEFKAPGDFAQAYVLAHEIGHHVQALTGVMAQVQQLMAEGVAPPNVLSIAQELQADCLAGVWAQSTYDRGLLERGDLQEALRAAEAVGDDRIQRRTIGRVIPEQWTHGSAAERRSWFERGFDSGEPADCDTFSRIL